MLESRQSELIESISTITKYTAIFTIQKIYILQDSAKSQEHTRIPNERGYMFRLCGIAVFKPFRTS